MRCERTAELGGRLAISFLPDSVAGMNIRNIYSRFFYRLDVALSRADSFLIGKLRESKWRNVLVGLCLTYASAGLWLVWEAWLTREADDLIFGIFHTCVGVVYATIMALRHSISTRIDYYAVRAIQEQSDGVELWNSDDDVVTHYLEKAIEELQGSGFIPFVDGASEDSRYEDLINQKAVELYTEDRYLANATKYQG
jgi:hypothetical protein